jgi:5-methyltetrahydropteroyltriglutamate--homocysteine methyltransferase
MELTLSNHSSFPRIGDSAELQLLRRTIGQFEKGQKGQADLRAAEDRMVELALEEQGDAGLDLVTDGLIRWYDPISHLAGKLAGARINGLLRFFDTNCYFRQPIIEARLERTRPLVVEEFEFARRKSSRPVKAVLTGPLTLARHSIVGNGTAAGGAVARKLVEEFTEALAVEVGALAAAGAPLIQIEEPVLLRHPEDLPFARQCLETFSGRKGAAQLALAVYFGDPAPIYDRLQALPVDMLVLDFTYSPALVGRAAASRSDKTLGLGLVDGRNTKLERPETVAHAVERIARGAGAGRIHLTTSCGLEYLPRDRASLKLKLLARIKDTLTRSTR